MLEQQLTKLQNLTVKENAKQNDWEQIKNKGFKVQKLYWKEVAVLVAVFALIFVLSSSFQNNAQQASSVPSSEMKTVYTLHTMANQKVEPISNFYPYVIKIKEENLMPLRKLINASKWEKIDGPVDGDYVEHIKITFADGTSKSLQLFSRGTPPEKTDYLYDAQTGYGYAYLNGYDDIGISNMIYRLTSQEVYKDTNWRLIASIGLLLFAIFGSLFGYIYYKDQKKPKIYSTPWQWIVIMCMNLAMIALTLYTQQVHFFWWIVMLMINIIIFVLLDKRTEHLKWRVANVLFTHAIAFSLLVREIYFMF